MSIIIDLKVTPNSGRQKFVIDKSDKLKCFLKNPAEKNKANKELIKLISKKLGLQRSEVIILMGSKSRNKKIKINTEMTKNEVFKKFGLQIQLKI